MYIYQTESGYLLFLSVYFVWYIFLQLRRPCYHLHRYRQLSLPFWFHSRLHLNSASKCDDISCSEVIRALKLEDDPTLEEIEDRLGNFRTNISKYKKQKNAADKLIKGTSTKCRLLHFGIHSMLQTSTENWKLYEDNWSTIKIILKHSKTAKLLFRS